MKGREEAEVLKGGWERKSQGAHHSFFPLFKNTYLGLPCGPGVETLPSNAEGAAGWISHASRPKNQNTKNRNNIVTNSIKTLKIVNIKKSLKRKTL